METATAADNAQRWITGVGEGDFYTPWIMTARSLREQFVDAWLKTGPDDLGDRDRLRTTILSSAREHHAWDRFAAYVCEGLKKSWSKAGFDPRRAYPLDGEHPVAPDREAVVFVDTGDQDPILGDPAAAPKFIVQLHLSDVEGGWRVFAYRVRPGNGDENAV